MRTSPVRRMSLRTSAHAGVAIPRSFQKPTSERKGSPLRFAGSILTLGWDCHTSDIGHWFAMTYFYHSAQKGGVLIPSAPVCALGQLPLVSKGSLASPYGRGAPKGRRGRFYPLSHCVTAPPEWEPRGKRIVTGGGHWFAMTYFYHSTQKHY